MINALNSLKSLIKTKYYHIDYPIFRLHYQATVSALLAFCLVLTAKVLFGDTIDCKSRGSKNDKFYDNLCFSQGTYTEYSFDLNEISLAAQGGSSADCGRGPDEISATINLDLPPGNSSNVGQFSPAVRVFPIDSLHQTDLGEFLKQSFIHVHRYIKNNNLCFSSGIKYIYPGVPIPNESEDVNRTYFWHHYYQYIPIILFLQAVFFYFPHYLWKNFEGGVISSICKQLHDNRFAPTEFIESNYQLIEYLHNCFSLNKSLVYKYYFCHLLLLLNLIGQIILLNAVFNNQFITYGMDMFHYLFIDSDIYGLRGAADSMTDLNNPMDFVFPKITQCTVQLLSPAGKVEELHQLLCVLPLNILHDKFYLILWFWFSILAIITMMQIVFDSLYVTMPAFRRYLFNRRFGSHLSEDNRHSSSLAELFILDLIGTNSDKFAFSSLLKKLDKEEYRTTPSENQSLV